MDWTLAIEKNREALKRILVMLVAMIEAAGGNTRGQCPLFAEVSELPRNAAPAEINEPSPTLPRQLHRLVLSLLRPAEAAVRRLIIVAAHGLVVELSPSRRRTAKPKPALTRRNGFGTGIVIRPGPLPEWARALAPKRSGALSFPLFDPLKRFGVRRMRGKPSAMPRIWSLDDRPFNPLFNRLHQPDPVPLPLTADDPLDAGRLARRLEAMAFALDDLPRQTKRLVRWRARRDAVIARERNTNAAGVQGGSNCAAGVQDENTARRFLRFSPMRPGRPPGWRRRPDHPVYEVLNEVHGLAVWTMERRDTS
jgi:hypothetical protein